MQILTIHKEDFREFHAKRYFYGTQLFFQIDAKIVYPIFPAPLLFVNRTVDVMFV